MDSKPSPFRVAAVVAFYMGAALVMVFVNKAVLNASPALPLLFLFVQLVMAVVLLHVSALFSSKVEIPRMELTAAKNLTPVILINIVGLVFNMLCLRDVEASFFQIARGLVLPLTIVVSSISTRMGPTVQVVISASIVMIGFFIGIVPERALPATSTPSILSLSYGFLSSFFIAIHAVLIKSSLPYCNNSTIQLAYWTNLGSAGFLAPFILLNGEPVKLLELISDPEQAMTTFIWGSIVTGVFGFLLCIAGLLSIKVTSPVTHMFSSAARSVIQTLLGVWLFQDALTINRVVSISTILAGTMYYTWLKSVQAATPLPRPVDLEALGNRSEGKDEEVLWQAPEKVDDRN